VVQKLPAGQYGQGHSDSDMFHKTTHLTHPEYRADIDGLRAIAVLSVVGFHAFPAMVPGGLIGVDIFFVISGFLISSIIFSNLEHDSFSIIEFYNRRIRRIFPALITILLVSFAFGWFALFADEYKQLGKHIAGGAGFISNFILWGESGYFDDEAGTKPMLHLWSLAIEEHFYIFWPLLLAFVWKRHWSFLRITALIGLTSLAANIYLVNRNQIAAFYSPASRFWELMIGGVLAYITLHRPELNGRYKNAQSVVGFALLLLGLVLINKSREYPGSWALLPTIGSFFTISAGAAAWINNKILSNKLLVWFGLISYPLYLWHWPLLSFAQITEGGIPPRIDSIIAVLASIALAWLTYRFIERKFRFGGDTAIKITVLLTLAVLLGAVGYLTFYNNGFERRNGLQAQELNSGDIGHDEFLKYPNRQFYVCTPPEIAKEALWWNGYIRCLQSKNTDKKDIAIIGDSHAEHLFIGLAEAADQKNVVYYIKGSLPVIDNEEFRSIYSYVLSDSSIQKVIISAFWIVRLHPDPRQFEHALKKTVDALTSADKSVYIVDDVPYFSFDPKKCKYKRMLVHQNQCSESSVDFYAQEEKYQNILESISKPTNHVRLLHPANYLCEQEKCFMAQQGIIYYRDRYHLNIFGSRYIASKILEDIPEILN
jgi:peptidoglycan/LPS O-acetylase OafA/YrhL